MSFLTKIFGDPNEKELKLLRSTADEIEALEPEIKVLSDDELMAKTDEFKKRLADGETIEDIMAEAFAIVRESSIRVLGQRPFYSQVIGAIVLHQGRIAEMKTGEGKTLAAVLAVYLNALSGKGAHVITVNGYLAKFQGEWMGRLYNFLGLSVGVILHDMSKDDRRAAYRADITYGTNNEFGFDYLRDNMIIYKEDMVQRDLFYAVVDEVDSILVDEARTPLIISGSGDKSTDFYTRADGFVRRLKIKTVAETKKSTMSDKFEGKDSQEEQDELNYDYIAYEKEHSVHLTKKGIEKAEKFFGVENLADPENATVSHHINQGLKAHGLMFEDKDYVLKDGQVIIVDQFTGRLMTGRRYSDGLHQAIEAKEKVTVERESKTLATITFQNYFRMYDKLSGMTGTAKTEEHEFRAIYGLDVVVIPTNKPMIRNDENDVINLSEKSKFNAVVEEIKIAHKIGQPVLVGTISIENSEKLSRMLKKEKIKHSVLNAKFHEKEAEIIAQAGKFGSVTIATNMAGRGTDIYLGGNPEMLAKSDMAAKGYTQEVIAQLDALVPSPDDDIQLAIKVYNKLHNKFKIATDKDHIKVVNVGGLYVIGTERHESRRIDNQLRGRSGRQGDPGKSKFYISLDDDLMRLFGSDRMTMIVEKLGLEDGQAIEYGLLSAQIEKAQKKVEGRNFNIRKSVLQYDDVMNQQRELIYKQRRTVLNGDDVKQNIIDMAELVIDGAVDMFTAEITHPEEWNLTGLCNHLEDIMLPPGMVTYTNEEVLDLNRESLKDDLFEMAKEVYKAKEKEIGEETMRRTERVFLLRVVDEKWMDHIDAMDQLRTGIGLRAYGQRDPVMEYKSEGFNMFEEMINTIQEDTVKRLFHVAARQPVQMKRVSRKMTTNRGEAVKQVTIRKGKAPGPNDPCPCGSGKKYKRCCGISK